jgi:hypothetical protein
VQRFLSRNASLTPTCRAAPLVSKNSSATAGLIPSHMADSVCPCLWGAQILGDRSYGHTAVGVGEIDETDETQMETLAFRVRLCDGEG